MKSSGINFLKKSKPSVLSSSYVKAFISQAKGNHLLIMAISCLVPIALLYVAVSFFGRDINSLSLVIVLVCPLMHFLMMKKH